MTIAKSILDKLLSGAIVDGINQSRDPFEERGGVILEKYGDYEFKLIKNIHTDTPVAYGLYEADRNEFGEFIIPLMTSGWKLFASFHTHPTFSATPSALDLAKLFQGFKHNVIYSVQDETCSISSWEGELLKTKYIPISTLLEISK